MKNDVMVVVGDKFAAFAAGKNVITVSQLRGLLTLPGSISLGRDKMVLVAGQGLGDDVVSSVMTLAETSHHREHFDFRHWRKLPRRAGPEITHKHRQDNILVSEARQIDPDRYVMDLLINENSELMHDHQTGQHLQGMILIEAARQALLVVTETFFPPPNALSRYFVINNLGVNYNAFAFPLEARLLYTIQEKDVTVPDRQRFKAEITVIQCGATAASVTIDFSTIESARITTREYTLAQQALETHIASLANDDAVLSPQDDSFTALAGRAL